MSPTTTAWVDASAGVAGDMLLGALVDAGADLDVVQRAVDAVLPGAVRLRRSEVLRAGLRAAKVDVDVLVADPPHRTWTTIRDLLADADLSPSVRDAATAVFRRLAEAEGRVHGISPEDVHFHEVGALDAVADVVGTCAALHDLGVDELVIAPIATGSGRVHAAHGQLPIPGPAVLQLVSGWDVTAGGPGELATPTGVALVTALGERSGPLPSLRVDRVGLGAGTRDTPGRANVVRVVLGQATASTPSEQLTVLEANVDDLDPRAWPEVLTALLAAGAADAWLTPILMKKGRPAHTLSVLADPGDAARLTDLVMAHTSTLGVRRTTVARDALDRAWAPVPVQGGEVRIKVGHRGGAVVQAMPEFADVAALAADLGRPVADVLVLAHAAAVDAGLVAGAPWPAEGTSTPR